MINVELKFSDVFNEVKRLTEYIGQKANIYDQVRAIDEDKDQMMFWYLDGVSLVNGILDRLLTRNIQPSYTTGDFTMVLSTDNHMGETILKIVERLIATHMVSQWLKVVAPNIQQVYLNDETAMSQELMRVAYYREMPH